MATHVYDYLLNAAAEVPDGAALEFMGKPVTYGKLAEGARKLARGLATQGIARGESVGLMLPNIPHFPEALYGAWLNGNVVVPINVLSTAPELRYLIDDSRIRAIFVFEMFLPQVDAALVDLPNPPRVFVVGNPGRHTAYTQLLDGQTPVERPEPSDADEHLLTIY